MPVCLMLALVAPLSAAPPLQPSSADTSNVVFTLVRGGTDFDVRMFLERSRCTRRALKVRASGFEGARECG